MTEIAQVRECYYGTGEIRGDKTIVTCLIDPQFPHRERRPYYRLVLDVKVPIAGPMVVMTLRRTKLHKNGFWRPGKPEKVVDISYDSDPRPPGGWRGRMQGEWPVKRVPIRLRSRWERLR